jgi:hypothetical protein
MYVQQLMYKKVLLSYLYRFFFVYIEAKGEIIILKKKRESNES